jgi:hypothetical protein
MLGLASVLHLDIIQSMAMVHIILSSCIQYVLGGWIGDPLVSESTILVWIFAIRFIVIWCMVYALEKERPRHYDTKSGLLMLHQLLSLRVLLDDFQSQNAYWYMMLATQFCLSTIH